MVGADAASTAAPAEEDEQSDVEGELTARETHAIKNRQAAAIDDVSSDDDGGEGPTTFEYPKIEPASDSDDEAQEVSSIVTLGPES